MNKLHYTNIRVISVIVSVISVIISVVSHGRISTPPPPGSSKHPPENVETPTPKKLETPPRNFTDF